MTCASCAAHVEGALSGIPGVLSANVNLATERVNVVFVLGVAGLEAFKQAVAESGYQVLDLEEDVFGPASTTSPWCRWQ
jgi:Cu+-exporting ATPase